MGPPEGLFPSRRCIIPNSRKSRVLLGMLLAVAVLGWTSTLVGSQGGLKGKVLPVVSSSDVIGYVAPCG